MANCPGYHGYEKVWEHINHKDLGFSFSFIFPLPKRHRIPETSLYEADLWCSISVCASGKQLWIEWEQQEVCVKTAFVVGNSLCWKRRINECQLHVSSPDFCSEMSTFISPVLSGHQKQLWRFRFRSLMEITFHGNILASNFVLICHNDQVHALRQPFLKGSVSTQALVLDAVKPKPSRLRDGNKITHTWASPSPLCPFSCIFFFFYVFIFGQGQQIDDGVMDSQCILGKTRNVVINSRRFSFTMAYCLALRVSEPVAAEPRRQG